MYRLLRLHSWPLAALSSTACSRTFLQRYGVLRAEALHQLHTWSALLAVIQHVYVSGACYWQAVSSAMLHSEWAAVLLSC
jgi:hypothetical protein